MESRHVREIRMVSRISGEGCRTCGRIASALSILFDRQEIQWMRKALWFYAPPFLVSGSKRQSLTASVRCLTSSVYSSVVHWSGVVSKSMFRSCSFAVNLFHLHWNGLTGVRSQKASVVLAQACIYQCSGRCVSGLFLLACKRC